jgi:hypothetical protein
LIIVFLVAVLGTGVPSSLKSWKCTFNTTSWAPRALLSVSTFKLSKDTYFGMFVMPPVFGAPAGAKLVASIQVLSGYKCQTLAFSL